MISAALTTSRTGRTILHLACLVRRPRNLVFHCAGVARELAGGTSTYYPSPSPLLPIALAAAVALMTWWCLR